MKIRTFVNFKMSSGQIWGAGIYDDSAKPFPKELYDEIQITRGLIPGKRKLEILVDNPKPVEEPAKSVEQQDYEVTTTLDTSEDSVETSNVDRKIRKRKK